MNGSRGRQVPSLVIMAVGLLPVILICRQVGPPRLRGALLGALPPPRCRASPPEYFAKRRMGPVHPFFSFQILDPPPDPGAWREKKAREEAPRARVSRWAGGYSQPTSLKIFCASGRFLATTDRSTSSGLKNPSAATLGDRPTPETAGYSSLPAEKYCCALVAGQVLEELDRVVAVGCMHCHRRRPTGSYAPPSAFCDGNTQPIMSIWSLTPFTSLRMARAK